MELTTAAIAVLLCLSTTSPVWSGDISLRWNSTYQEVYYSRADGAGVPFEVRLPPAIEGLETTYMKGPKPLSYTYLGRARIA